MMGMTTTCFATLERAVMLLSDEGLAALEGELFGDVYLHSHGRNEGGNGFWVVWVFRVVGLGFRV